MHFYLVRLTTCLDGWFNHQRCCFFSSARAYPWWMACGLLLPSLLWSSSLLSLVDLKLALLSGFATSTSSLSVSTVVTADSRWRHRWRTANCGRGRWGVTTRYGIVSTCYSLFSLLFLFATLKLICTRHPISSDHCIDGTICHVPFSFVLSCLQDVCIKT
jgi:hypothetical protein